MHVARYPLAPEHDVTHAEAFLAALHDRFAPAGLLHVIGDSAGGTLSLLLSQAHVDRGTIAGLTLIAPWLDLSMTNPAVDLVEPHDPWLTRAGMPPIAAHWVAGRDLTDPAVSPLYGDLTGLPPTLGRRRVARHLPARLRPAGRAGPVVGRPQPARGGWFTARLPPAPRCPRGAGARQAITDHVLRTLSG